MKKLLIVAYAFPPVGGAGVQRIIKFIKYLRHYNWSADALSVSNPSVPLEDKSLGNELPSDCRVFRSKTLEPSYKTKSTISDADNRRAFSPKPHLMRFLKKCFHHILLPDAQVLWWPHTYFLLKKLLKTKQYSAVFVSGPPFSTLFLVTLVGRLVGVPVVVDYRDEWTFSRNNWENAAKTNLARTIDSSMESFVIRHASAIVVASPFYERSLRERFPLAANKIQTITNGYDPDDIAKANFISYTHYDSNIFTLLYTGTVWKATSFQALLEGLRLLLPKYPNLSSQICLRIIGRIVHDELAVIDQVRTLVQVETLGYLPHEDIFTHIAAADCMLITLADLPGADKIIPGKIFEYLATPLPILALLPDGVTTNLIKDETNIYIAKPNDATAVSMTLQHLLSDVIGHEYRIGIEKFSRLNLTGQLARLLNKLTLHDMESDRRIYNES